MERFLAWLGFELVRDDTPEVDQHVVTGSVFLEKPADGVTTVVIHFPDQKLRLEQQLEQGTDRLQFSIRAFRRIRGLDWPISKCGGQDSIRSS